MVLWLAMWGCSGPDGPKKPSCISEIPYDGIDQDCSGADLVDVDGDGFDSVSVDGGTDCDDANITVHPEAAEVPYDGIDQDCSGADLVDVDGDGIDAVEAGGIDCDDTDISVFPGAPDDLGDGIDNNCDGLDGVDADGDGWASAASGGVDCADDDPARNPDAIEIWYDGIDQDCDRWCDYDRDHDGAVLPGSPVIDGTPCDTEPSSIAFAPEDCDDDDPAFFTLGVARTWPWDGAVGVFPSIVLSVTLSGQPDPNATLALSDADGNLVPGSLSRIEVYELQFVPDLPLDWLATYTVTVTHACGVETFTFTTEGESAPVDELLLPGRAWSFALGAGDWVEPPGIGDLIGSMLGDSGFVLEVLGVTTPDLALRWGVQIDGTQDLCTPTSDLGGLLAPNPYLSTDPNELPLSLGGTDVLLGGANLSARIDTDGSTLVQGILTGMIDTIPLAEAFGLGYAPDAVCQLVATFGILCSECSDGSGPYCLPVVVRELSGSDLGESLVERTEADITADPLCP